MIFAAVELMDAVKTAQGTMDNLSAKMQALIEHATSTKNFENHNLDLDLYFERFQRTKENTINSSKVKMSSHLNPAPPSQAHSGASTAGCLLYTSDAADE